MPPPPSSSIANDLAERIRQRVQEGDLSDGASFSTEAELADEYGVSRNIAREAVCRLKALGILESRRRKGLLVRHPDPIALLSRSLPSLAGSGAHRHELSMLRYVIEVGAIELAVQNATAEEIGRLLRIATQFEQIVEGGGGDAKENELELAFHGLILKMTHSVVIAGLQQVLSTFFKCVSDARPPAAVARQCIWEHYAIVNAIRDRDAESARSIIRTHFKPLLISTST